MQVGRARQRAKKLVILYHLRSKAHPKTSNSPAPSSKKRSTASSSGHEGDISDLLCAYELTFCGYCASRLTHFVRLYTLENDEAIIARMKK